MSVQGPRADPLRSHSPAPFHPILDGPDPGSCILSVHSTACTVLDPAVLGVRSKFYGELTHRQSAVVLGTLHSTVQKSKGLLCTVLYSTLSQLQSLQQLRLQLQLSHNLCCCHGRWGWYVAIRSAKWDDSDIVSVQLDTTRHSDLWFAALVHSPRTILETISTIMFSTSILLLSSLPYLFILLPFIVFIQHHDPYFWFPLCDFYSQLFAFCSLIYAFLFESYLSHYLSY